MPAVLRLHSVIRRDLNYTNKCFSNDVDFTGNAKFWYPETLPSSLTSLQPSYSFTESEYEEDLSIAISSLYIEISVRNQFKNIEEINQKYSINEIIRKVRSVTADLLCLRPESIKVFLTSDETLFFTIKMYGFTFFISIFLDFEVIDEEASLVCYKGDVKLPSTAGRINLVIDKIKQLCGFIQRPVNQTFLM